MFKRPTAGDVFIVSLIRAEQIFTLLSPWVSHTGGSYVKECSIGRPGDVMVITESNVRERVRHQDR